MTQLTKAGRDLRVRILTAGAEIPQDNYGDVGETLSLIARHAKTYRRLAEIQCGDGIHSGEWVNTHWDWITKRDTQIETRLLTLARDLPSNVSMELQGDPRGYLVRLVVVDTLGVLRTVGVN